MGFLRKRPPEKKAKSRHPIRDNLEVLIFAVVMAMGLKVFGVEAYQIPTGSMQPTLMGTELHPEGNPPVVNGGIHDRVLVDKVSYLLRDPERWEVVVFRYPLATVNNYVKRLVGMPGESLWIRDGDIWTRPLDDPAAPWRIQRKPPGLQDHLWRHKYPKARVPASAWAGWVFQGRVTQDGEARLLEGRAGVRLARSLVADYLDGYPEALVGRIRTRAIGGGSYRAVGDVRLRFAAVPGEGAGELTAVLQRSPDYRVRLVLDPARDAGRLELPDGRQLPLEDLGLAPGEEVTVDLAHWDQRVRLRLRAGRDLDLLEDLELGDSMPVLDSTVRIESDAGRWSLPEQPEVSRDLHWLPSSSSPTAPGQFDIPEGQYLMLGDNTQNSWDGRDWLADIVKVEPPIQGRTTLRGDHLEGSADPFTNNPRWNRDQTVMTFRDQHGDLFALPEDRYDFVTYQEPLHTVPRAYILGKAMAVFLPVPPFSPVVRIRTVR